jgi:signal transduction histidine kinase
MPPIALVEGGDCGLDRRRWMMGGEVILDDLNAQAAAQHGYEIR